MVLENVMEVLIQVLGLSKQEVCEWVVKYLVKVGIDECQQVKYLVYFFGGQQQCVFIVCVLVMELEVLLFDELIFVLDLELVGEVLCIMQQLVEEGKIMVVVIYEMGFVCYVFLYVIFLYQGKIEEEGYLDVLFGVLKSLCLQQFLKGLLK